jgi:hypothetical protein
VPAEITFPDAEPQYVFDRDVLAFRAYADGKPLEVMVTAELMITHFSARDMTEDALRDAYHEHKGEIQQIASGHIENGWVDDEGRVFLTTRFTRLKVTFAANLVEWPEGLAMAKDAHRVLADIIGPSAEEVAVEWFRSESLSPEPCIAVRISDLPAPDYVAFVFGLRELRDQTILRILLGNVWSTVLRARSRRLNFKSG